MATNISLNFAIIINPPSVTDCFLNATCSKPGFAIEAIQLMCKFLKYNCTLTWSGTDVYGYLENGTWYGVIGLIKDGKFDLAMPKYIPTADRWKAVDFTEGFFYENMLLATRHPATMARTAELNLLGGFKWHVWLCIAALMFLAVHLMEDTLIIKRKKAIVHSLLEKHVSKLLFHCRRFCIILISLAALILLRSYTGYIFSQDVTLYPEAPFTDLKSFVECMESSKCQLATTSPTVGYAKDVFNSNDGDLYRRLRKAMIKNPLQSMWPTKALLSAVQNEKSKFLTAFISDSDFYYVAQQNHCKFYKLPTLFPAGPRASPVRKQSPALRQLNGFARRFRESGISKKILSDYQRLEEDTCPKAEQSLHAASFGFLMDVFIFYAVCTFAAIMVFVGEKLSVCKKPNIQAWA